MAKGWKRINALFPGEDLLDQMGMLKKFNVKDIKANPYQPEKYLMKKLLQEFS